jgi:hypothetical protein
MENVEALSNFIVFKTEVYDAISRIISFFDSVGFRSKLEEMITATETADTKILEINAALSTISDISEAILLLNQSIEQSQELNAEQQQMIDINSRMVAQVEKQIEDYVFFAEEFDEIYRQARLYVTDVASLTKRTVEAEAKVDTVLALVVADIPIITASFDELKQYISTLSERLATDSRIAANLFQEAYGEVTMAATLRDVVVGPIVEEIEDNKSRLQELRNNL